MKNQIVGIHYATKKPTVIEVEDGFITDIQPLDDDTLETLPYIAPGLVDLQINGFRGFDFNSLPFSEQLVIDVTKELWKEGITTYYPTVITNSDDAIEEAVRTIVRACEKDPLTCETIGGIHIEGPFISPEDGPRGAHGKEYVKAPDWDLMQKWQNAAKGKIKIVTLSPEWEGSASFIEKCVENDIIISIGHTAANSEQISEAVRAGAKMSTHIGNGAHLMLPRHPNYLWEQLADDHLWACLIADGFHLPLSFLKVAMKVKESQAMLVSDAVYLSGLEPGEYDTHIGGKVVLTPEGKLHTKDNSNILAGSAQMLIHGIAHLVNNQVTTIQEAWEMASVRPSVFMGHTTQQGLSIGAPADIVLFKQPENTINVLQSYKSGCLVYSV
ncbi:N-acetylglucosamine-6-phosphate deacetylase [Bacillus niameyensis]|uniref:N-acetylglucosamine-6-phosphate deacetylase n=1 Tax=Bacillus niameyensis TaxID=1522308 RepID=UPI000782C881|nr:amidohydrolase family protein [Bacillus niameyensis]